MELNKQRIDKTYELDSSRAIIAQPMNLFACIFDLYWLAFETIAWVLIKLERDISRHDQRDVAYDFGDNEMVVRANGMGGTSTASAQGGANTGLDILTEGKELDNKHDGSNLDDANDMEFAFDSDADYDTNENSIKQKDSGAKNGLANSIELGHNIDQDEYRMENMNNVNAKKSKNKHKNHSNNNNSKHKNKKTLSHKSETSDDVNLMADDNSSASNNDYRNRYKNMKRKILIHSGNGSSRATTIVIAYLVARAIRFNNEENKLLNDIRIELFKQNPKYPECIRERRMESQNKYTNELIYELDPREFI